MAQILIESKPALFQGFPKRHLYLVFRDDNGFETVIRGGVSRFLNIVVENDIPIALSDDARGNDTPQDRGSTALNLGGRNASEVWQIMGQQVANIARSHLIYNPFAQNSNSVVTSVLNALGITSETTLPVGTTISDFPAVGNRLDIRTTLLGGVEQMKYMDGRRTIGCSALGAPTTLSVTVETIGFLVETPPIS